MGARFEALDEGVLAAASKLTWYFFAISISQKVRCTVKNPKKLRWPVYIVPKLKLDNYSLTSRVTHFATL